MRQSAGAGRQRLSSGVRHRGSDQVKPEQLEKWKQTRAKGMFRYVLLSGVFSYGLAMFVVMTFVVNSDKLSSSFVGFSAILWTVGGALFGLATWFVQERQFRKPGDPAA